MGKRITQQARGKGSLTFRVRRKAYSHKIGYPPLALKGKAKIVKLFNSAAHSAPLAKIVIEKTTFFTPAVNEIYEGQGISLYGDPKVGNILRLKDIPQGIKICNIESVPGKGGVYMRSAGSSAIVMAQDKGKVEILIRRRRVKINKDARATIGVVAGDGRLSKPIGKAGKQHHLMKSKGRKWHRTSAVKVNAVDHPFGSGRGKRIKSKIAKRNAPPGLKVGHLRPRKTGRKKIKR
jgi:large subunit ribosomal protein L2